VVNLHDSLTALLTDDRSVYCFAGWHLVWLLQVPLPLLGDLATGACAWSISLPDPRSSSTSIAAKIKFVTASLAKAAFGTTEDEQETLRAAAAAVSGLKGAKTSQVRVCVNMCGNICVNLCGNMCVNNCVNMCVWGLGPGMGYAHKPPWPRVGDCLNRITA
jgi:hypothetical protein